MAKDETPKDPKSETVKVGELKLNVPVEVQPGVYSNLVVINHSPEEFVLDFSFVEPASRRATVRARVVVTPGHLKRLLSAMQQNLQRYEQTFGAIVEPKPRAPKKRGGEPVN